MVHPQDVEHVDLAQAVEAVEGVEAP